MCEPVITEDKIVVVAVRHEDERQAVTRLLTQMGLSVHNASSGKETIFFLEDHGCAMLVLDLQLSDMHAWRLLNTLKESVDLRSLPTIVIMDESTVIPLSNVTPVVRPVSMSRLRQVIGVLLTS